MNIWQWVVDLSEQLADPDRPSPIPPSDRRRLVELIELVPEYACRDHHRELDALIPEAVALARALEHRWLELFFRHWHLQSRVLHRNLVSQSLPEAVSLLEFASRDEARGCPQAICVTQDLANCYAYLDGPSYAAERLEVADESLRRIDPRWPCYACISMEYATALVDDGRAEEALRFLNDKADQMRAAGHGEDAERLTTNQASTLLELGRLEEAKVLAERAKDSDEVFKVKEAQLILAQALAELGHGAEAAENLVPFEGVLETLSFGLSWARGLRKTVQAGGIENSWSLERPLNLLFRRMLDNGVLRHAFEVGVEQATLAQGRGAFESVRRTIRSLEALLPALRFPLDAPRKLAALVAALPAPEPIPELPLETLLGEPITNPEHALRPLTAALERFPESAELRQDLFDVCEALGREVEFREQLAALHRARPGDPALTYELGRLYLHTGAEQALARLIENARTEPGTSGIALRLSAALAERQGSSAAYERALVEWIANEPAAAEPHAALSLCRLVAGATEAALELAEAAVARSETPGEPDVARMLAATKAEDWPAMRDSAARLGIELPGEGAIELPLGLCRVRFAEHEARLAVRTGPVSARLIHLFAPNDPQCYGDRVLIRPEAEDGPPDDDEIPVHRYVAHLSDGHYQVEVVQGVEPQPALRDALYALAERFAIEPRPVGDPEQTAVCPDGEVRPVFTLFLAAPPEIDWFALHEALSTLFADLSPLEPVVWPGIARRAGRPDLAALGHQIEIDFTLFDSRPSELAPAD